MIATDTVDIQARITAAVPPCNLSSRRCCRQQTARVSADGEAACGGAAEDD